MRQILEKERLYRDNLKLGCRIGEESKKDVHERRASCTTLKIKDSSYFRGSWDLHMYSRVAAPGKANPKGPEKYKAHFAPDLVALRGYC